MFFRDIQAKSGMVGNYGKFACIHIFFLACALSGYIFVNPFTSCVTDRYQHIIMETETETNMKICMY